MTSTTAPAPIDAFLAQLEILPQRASVRETRHALFEIDAQAAHILRRHLFEIHDQDGMTIAELRVNVTAFAEYATTAGDRADIDVDECLVRL